MMLQSQDLEVDEQKMNYSHFQKPIISLDQTKQLDMNSKFDLIDSRPHIAADRGDHQTIIPRKTNA